MGNKAVIVGAGSAELSEVDFSQYKFIVGCDGGAQSLSDLGIVPHVIIGDFDSLDTSTIMEMFMLGVARRGLPGEKDFTDMKGAVDFVAGLDYDEIDFYGAVGSRLDHSIGNMMMLFDLLDKGIKGRIINESNVVSALMAKAGSPAECVVDDVPEGAYVSFVPVGPCKNVKIEGLKYALDGVDLDYSDATHAISNEFVGAPGRVSFDEGRMLMFISRD